MLIARTPCGRDVLRRRRASVETVQTIREPAIAADEKPLPDDPI